MNWLPVKKLNSGKVREQMWTGPVDDPWSAAEQYMKDGYLPPIILCEALVTSPPVKFTRNRAWVLAGAIQSVKHLEGDTAALRKNLRALGKP
jgi:hypothetical protein